MNGRIILAIKRPPAIKQMVATSDENCRLLKPIMECPEVHPFAYRVPKPTRNPPSTSNINPLKVNKDVKLKISGGNCLS